MISTADKYNYLKDLVTSDRKDSFLSLMNYIESNTEYLTSPASTKYHLCTEGGLLEHSVSVCITMIKIKKVIAPEISDEKCVIVSLLHDLGKVGYPGNPQYLKNEPTERQKQYGYGPTIPYRYNDNIVQMPHAHRSIYLILSNGFKLEPDECQAILAHDGQYVDDNKSYAHKEEKLTMLLHYADLWSCKFLEE